MDYLKLHMEYVCISIFSDFIVFAFETESHVDQAGHELAM